MVGLRYAWHALHKSAFLRDYWINSDGICGKMKMINYSFIIRKHIQISSRKILFCLVTNDLFTMAAFMLILRRQNQRFETLIQNADPKRPSREYCSCFPREEDDFVSMHCALFEMWFCDFAFMLPPESAFCSNHDRKRTFLGVLNQRFETPFIRK